MPTSDTVTALRAAVEPLEVRLLLRAVEMGARLSRAALAIEVSMSALGVEEPGALMDVEELRRLVVVDLPPVAAPCPYETPAAAALQRAAHRLASGGWCQGATVDAEGRRCLYGAVRVEAPTDRAEADALAVLLEAIRQRFPTAESVPDANDRHIRDERTAVLVLTEAARLADAHGL